MARVARVDRGNFVWWNGKVTGKDRKCFNHAHAQSFDRSETIGSIISRFSGKKLALLPWTHGRLFSGRAVDRTRESDGTRAYLHKHTTNPLRDRRRFIVKISKQYARLPAAVRERSPRSADIEPSETMETRDRNAGKKYNDSAFSLCLYRPNAFQVPERKPCYSHFKATKVYQLTKSYTTSLERRLCLEMQTNEIHAPYEQTSQSVIFILLHICQNCVFCWLFCDATATTATATAATATATATAATITNTNSQRIWAMLWADELVSYVNCRCFFFFCRLPIQTWSPSHQQPIALSAHTSLPNSFLITLSTSRTRFLPLFWAVFCPLLMASSVEPWAS